MTAKKIIGKIHLWLGFATGIIVFIVSITGAIYAFQEEITALQNPWRKVAVKNTTQVSPLQIAQEGARRFKGGKLSYLIYNKGHLVETRFEKDKQSAQLFFDPYSGKLVQLIKEDEGHFDFFEFVLHGHRFLWFPYQIGRPIVNYATVGFIILLISGLILWWPKNKSAAKQRYWFRWKDNTQWKRKNYDLHNILGFYAMTFLLCIALTGTIWGLEWMSQSIYWATSGGNTIEEYKERFSDTTKAIANPQPVTAVNKVWQKLHSEYKNEAFGMYISVPESRKETIYATVYLSEGQYYRNDGFEFDQHTLQPIDKVHDPYSDKYEKAGFADRLRRMNYDIHVGSILGFPGKCLAFVVAIISASLPVTGIYIWWGRRKKTKKGKKQEPAAQAPNSNLAPRKLHVRRKPMG